jgi:hypothetical protein
MQEIKVQRYSLYRGSLEPTTNGGWLKYEDAKAIFNRMKSCESCKHSVSGWEGYECTLESVDARIHCYNTYDHWKLK